MTFPTREQLIEKMAEAIQEARKVLYDTVKNATNSEPTHSNLQNRHMRKDLAEFFADKALNALIAELPYKEKDANPTGTYYKQLKEMGK